MSQSPSPAVVLLHGLPLADDRFADLLTLEQDLTAAGFSSIRFEWPAAFNAIRALMDRDRSFSEELARALDTTLRREIATQQRETSWIVVAHSGGGMVFYRWLLAHSSRFQADTGMLPDLAFLFAAPYKCELQRIRLPNGRTVNAREPAMDPTRIGGALPNRLIVFTTPDDETTLAMDTVFPAGSATQYVIEHSTHRDICSAPLARRLVAHHVRELLSSK
jgi:pimeloyl-ACP methyl ester carboxylesterase